MSNFFNSSKDCKKSYRPVYIVGPPGPIGPIGPVGPIAPQNNINGYLLIGSVGTENASGSLFLPAPKSLEENGLPLPLFNYYKKSFDNELTSIQIPLELTLKIKKIENGYSIDWLNVGSELIFIVYSIIDDRL